jgi:hypothetical protein
MITIAAAVIIVALIKQIIRKRSEKREREASRVSERAEAYFRGLGKTHS